MEIKKCVIYSKNHLHNQNAVSQMTAQQLGLEAPGWNYFLWGELSSHKQARAMTLLGTDKAYFILK